MNIGNWIRKWSLITPKKTAIIEGGRQYSYGELNERCNKVANFLLQKGLHSGDRVAILSYNSHKFMEVCFASAKTGSIFVPLNWRMAPEELAGVLNDCSPKFLFFAEEFLEAIQILRNKVESIGHLVNLGPEGHMEGSGSERIDGYPSNEPVPPNAVRFEDPHLILYTSGTTGVPKGVVLSNRKTFFNALNANIFFKLTSDDVFLVSRPLFHSGGLLINSLPVFYKGATVIYKRRFSAHEYVETVEKYGVTLSEPAATFLNFVLMECDLERCNLGSLKCLYTGGERVPPTLLQQYHERNLRLSQLFGMTETSTLTWLPVEDALAKAGSVGKSVFHGEVRIVDTEGREISSGENGEIIVSGPILMSGYWNREEQTQKVIRDGWFHSGDLATVDDEGYIYVIDRIDDTYISGGENIHPSELEKVLLSNRKISDVAAYGVPDKKWGEVGKVSVILKKNESMTPGEVVEFLEGKIGKYKIPKYVDFVTELPRTASGKIKRYLLVEKFKKDEALAK
jgi:fatty-acyl-CoA synthase